HRVGAEVAARRRHRREDRDLLDRRRAQRARAEVARDHRCGCGGRRVRRRLRRVRRPGHAARGAAADRAARGRRGRQGADANVHAPRDHGQDRRQGGLGETRRPRPRGRDRRRQARGRAGAHGRRARGEGDRAGPGGRRGPARARVRQGLAAHGNVGEGALRDRRHGRRAAARPQGDGRGRRGRRVDRRTRPAPARLRQHPVVHLLPSPDRVDRVERGARARAGPRRHRRQVPVHGQRQGGRAGRDRGVHQGRGRQGDRRAPRRAHRRPRGDRDHPRIRRRANAGSHARGDHPHDPRSPDLVRGGAGGHARRPRAGDPHLTRPPAAPPRWRRARSWIVVAWVVLTFIAFAPSLLSQFVDWDDLENFTVNPFYRVLGWSHLKWMWTTTLLGHYVPLTWMTLGADYLVWGMNPAGYHLTNVVLHCANVALLYFVTLRLLGAAMPATAGHPLAWRLGAAFAALVFGVHPLRVESVAWITERRDVLSGFFYLLAICASLRDAEAPSGRSIRRRAWYWVALGSFALGLLAKAIVVTLPLVLVVLDVYPLRRLGGARGWWNAEARRRWVEKVPFFLGGALVIPI